MEFGGYFPGAIGQLTGLHAVYYHQHWDFDLSFEAQVSSELAEFLSRFDPERDFFCTAEQDGRLMGAVAIDHSAEGGPRLRWLIVDEAQQGQGLGAKLISEAIEFCRTAGHKKVHLWTFEGLGAARALYERNGFSLVQERQGDKWGSSPNEQKFELQL